MALYHSSAVSVPSNIAESQGRLTEGEFQHFLGQARGSLWELNTQIEIARRLNYFPAAQHTAVQNMGDELGKILNGLMNSDLKSHFRKAGQRLTTNN